MSLIIGVEEPVQQNDCLYELRPEEAILVHWHKRLSTANRYSIVWTGGQSRASEMLNGIATATVGPNDRVHLLTWWESDAGGWPAGYFATLKRRHEDVALKHNVCVWIQSRTAVQVPNAKEQRPHSLAILVTGPSALKTSDIIEPCIGTLRASLSLGRFEASLDTALWMSRNGFSMIWRRPDDIDDRGMVILTPRQFSIDDLTRAVHVEEPLIYTAERAAFAWRQGFNEGSLSEGSR